MPLIRPEARAALLRWREVLFGAFVTAIGANWALAGIGIIRWIGWPVLLVGLALVVAGLQRARVRPRSGGQGMVELDEGQLTYFVAEGGIVVPLSLVSRIEIETTGAPGRDTGERAEGEVIWIFTDREGNRARIPSSAAGGERLLDALAHFPGAHYQKVIAASAARKPENFVIWQQDVVRLH